MKTATTRVIQRDFGESGAGLCARVSLSTAFNLNNLASSFRLVWVPIRWVVCLFLWESFRIGQCTQSMLRLNDLTVLFALWNLNIISASFSCLTVTCSVLGEVSDNVNVLLTRERCEGSLDSSCRQRDCVSALEVWIWINCVADEIGIYWAQWRGSWRILTMTRVWLSATLPIFVQNWWRNNCRRWGVTLFLDKSKKLPFSLSCYFVFMRLFTKKVFFLTKLPFSLRLHVFFGQSDFNSALHETAFLIGFVWTATCTVNC